MNIAYMSKVTLSLSAGEEGKGSEDGEDSKRFEFVYGIGPEGLTPFERVLEGRREKEELVLEIGGYEATHVFRHLWMPDLEALFHRGSPFLKIAVLSVSEADPREVIRALAETAGCGDDCCGH
jgi:hypothetical protein